ncbi:alpha/beta fold hydrolase [Nonomuraea sp. SYSU D8015]|uniref:alpha/beta fold hydrolase n=1 Tax=Nonomuraea sp. SYSU D8015 TaxID=2593644 RepID=UPI001CB75C47|nr:hypothetical protein [Nonomuraea sp. SYSU D8015]
MITSGGLHGGVPFWSHREQITDPVAQNGNAYAERLSDGARLHRTAPGNRHRRGDHSRPAAHPYHLGHRPPFFPQPGARTYLRDLPDAELHLFDTGHFALETHLPQIAPLIDGFLKRVWTAE